MANKKKTRGPREGETVYLIGDPKSVAMRLLKIFTENGKKKGRCIWDTYHLVDGESLKDKSYDKVFAYERLTITSPPMLTDILPAEGF